MTDRVREPIQVYLTAAERSELDQIAREMGVSRSEVLRRGIRSVRRASLAGPLAHLDGSGLVSPATIGPGSPPPSAPVAPLADLLDELDEDRADR